MGIDDKIDLDGWKKIDIFSEEIDTENEIVRTEIVNGKTIRKFREYAIISYGSVYQKGEETRNVEEGRQREFVREYTSEAFVGNLSPINQNL